MVRVSKFVSQPLVLWSVTAAQGAVHPVAIVTIWSRGTTLVTVGLPEQLSVIVLLVPPPL